MSYVNIIAYILISALSAEVGYYYAEMLAILKLQFNTNHPVPGPLNEGSLFYNKI